MLLKSGINMYDSLLDFFSNSNKVQIYSAYIKYDALRSLIDSNVDKIESVCVRWESRDLIQGSSDIEVYEYLKQNNIPLYINRRLHLKAYIDKYRICYIGSNNISERAIAKDTSQSYNYEVGSFIPELSLLDRLYFRNIIKEATLVDDGLYNALKEFVKNQDGVILDYDFPVRCTDKNFLISALPICETVSQLVDIYYNYSDYCPEDIECMLHDISLYGLSLSMTQEMLISSLKTNFFNHPFISSFITYLVAKKQLFFGETKQWIQDNCTNVPLPRKWELTQNVQILFRWIQELSDGKYIINRPNYSECLECR